MVAVSNIMPRKVLPRNIVRLCYAGTGDRKAVLFRTPGRAIATPCSFATPGRGDRNAVRKRSGVHPREAAGVWGLVVPLRGTARPCNPGRAPIQKGEYHAKDKI